MRRLWRENRTIFVAFVLATALALFFGGRLVSNWIYWNDPAHRDQAIAGWMTPRYVAHSWGLPPELVINVLGIERTPGHPPMLSEIAAARGTTVDVLAAEIETAAARYRENRP
jgi:hypothetical protein